MRCWIDRYATVSNAIAELIADRMKETILLGGHNAANYFFLDRSDPTQLIDLKIETNAKVNGYEFSIRKLPSTGKCVLLEIDRCFIYILFNNFRRFYL